MQKIVSILWGKSVKVSLAGSNLFVFSFANATNRDWVLKNGPWHIQNKHMVLRKWQPNLGSLVFDLHRIPVWIQLYNVPLELYSKLGLSYIASAVGFPLYMDSVTTSKTRLEFTKVCVELEVDASIPKHINVLLRDGSTAAIRVWIPWMPSRCSNWTAHEKDAS
ncbi:hypothetical protein V6N13_093325 [Hibiscus sabdariffa]